MLIQTAWHHRKLVVLAVAVGVLLWFIVANRTEVVVVLPFWLGSFETRSGLAMLFGALAGAIVTLLAIGATWTIRRAREAPEARPLTEKPPWVDDELPPPDYAARTPEGFSDTGWKAR
jgi:uncharacterized integral membrane protein